MIPLILNLPMLVVDGARRRSIWFEGPDVSSHLWALVAMVTLIITALGLIYSYAIPDFAAMRDHSSGWKQRFGSWLARGWVGSNSSVANDAYADRHDGDALLLHLRVRPLHP